MMTQPELPTLPDHMRPVVVLKAVTRGNMDILTELLVSADKHVGSHEGRREITDPVDVEQFVADGEIRPATLQIVGHSVKLWLVDMGYIDMQAAVAAVTAEGQLPDRGTLLKPRHVAVMKQLAQGDKAATRAKPKTKKVRAKAKAKKATKKKRKH